MADSGKRPYRAGVRAEGAARTRQSILDAGKFLFSRKGIDGTTIAQIAERAGVSEASVYATVKSKAGLLDALMRDALFGPRYAETLQRVQAVTDARRRIGLVAHVARAIYEGESAELSLLMKSSAFSPQLRKSQQAFETLRRKMQDERVTALFAAGGARPGLSRDDAATILWALTSRELFHKLVHESGWPADRYQDWLERTLLESLTDGALG